PDGSGDKTPPSVSQGEIRPSAPPVPYGYESQWWARHAESTACVSDHSTDGSRFRGKLRSAAPFPHESCRNEHAPPSHPTPDQATERATDGPAFPSKYESVQGRGCRDRRNGSRGSAIAQYADRLRCEPASVRADACGRRNSAGREWRCRSPRE